MRKNFIIFILIIIFLVSLNIISFSQSPYEKSEIKNPIITERGITFKYKGDASSIYLKGSFDNWKLKYPFVYDSKKEEWTLFLPSNEESFQLKAGKYKYRLIVDGIFLPDPMNEINEEDSEGEIVSIFEVYNDILYFEKSPRPVKDKKGYYDFYFYRKNAKRVHLVGTFNQWDPNERKLVYKGNGNWIAEVKLLPGEYYYNFIVDGDYIKDPLNINTAKDQLGRTLSYYKIEND